MDKILSVDFQIQRWQAGAVKPPIFHIGKVVREVRKAQGLTLIQAAQRSGLDKNTWSRLERLGGPFEDQTLSKIASALGLTVAGLYALESEQRVRIRTAVLSQMADHKDVVETSQQGYTAPPSPIPELDPGGAVVMADADSDRDELLHCYSLMSPERRVSLLEQARTLAASSLTECNRGGFEARQRKKTGG